MISKNQRRTNEKHNENRKNHEQKITGLKEQIEERRRKIYLLDLQGYSNQEIANKLGVSLSTIEKDLYYMKYYCVKWYRDLDESGSGLRVLESCSQIDLVQKELWDLYRNEKLASTKKRILDSIVANSIKKREIYSSSHGISNKFELQSKNFKNNIDKMLAEDYNIKRQS